MGPWRTNWEVGEPWWPQPAIAYAAHLVHPGDAGFEWGSGGSTIWLTNRGVKVSSIEHSPEWLGNVRARCPQADIRLIPGVDRGELRSEPQLDDEGAHFFDDYVGAIDTVPDDSLAVVIVDGICRLECARRAARKLRAGGVLIMDDTERPFLAEGAALLEELRGWRVVRKRGFKRRDAALTETSFFHKP
jgi:SAM-dependent methyltransferase